MVVAKVIQNLANNMFFGKQVHMAPLNDFLKDNIVVVTRFLSDLNVRITFFQSHLMYSNGRPEIRYKRRTDRARGVDWSPLRRYGFDSFAQIFRQARRQGWKGAPQPF